MKLKYVANQITPEGLDEVQRLLICYKLGHHIALSGWPGVGKTQLLEQLPSIVKRPMFDITCDKYMTEGPLIGQPELRGNGTTHTEWTNGVATQAATEDGIFYADEFDQLDGSVQKRHNSLFDDRRRIRRRDGLEIIAGDKFFGAIAYNPGERMSKHELEDSVADRFVHASFKYLPPSLEAALALGETAGLNFETRAILYSEDSVRFIKKDGKNWRDIFTNEQVTHADSAFIYDMLPRTASAIPPPIKLKRNELANRIADYFVAVRTFSDSGTTQLEDPIKQYLKSIGETNHVQLHKPSTRIIKAAIGQYDLLVGLGMEPVAAQTYAARLCIDQIAYGKAGLKTIGAGKSTVYDALVSLAEFKDLLGRPKQTTNFTP